ncbi:hypothetical protein GWI33_009440 [Rhynchophorus ferrugineus]|uniref:RNase H type-1 domain-containing protein n=1 Tax=Rhynchophorus ferrugineus TaxID=354439 RepID=A0A834IN84_RHYFE|nr:hypothetical protein GWI33_009440 [Rhynchophorus ferrugineus]
MSSLDSLISVKTVHPLVIAIRELHTALEGSGVRINYLWVPSHRGIPGNERADYLTSRKEESIKLSVLFSKEDAKTHIKTLYKKLDQLNWDLLMENNKLWENKGVFHQSPNINNLNRDPPQCDEFQIQQSIKHILLECQKFEVLRQQLGMPRSLKQLVQPKHLDMLLNYLTAAGLVHLL